METLSLKCLRNILKDLNKSDNVEILKRLCACKKFSKRRFCTLVTVPKNYYCESEYKAIALPLTLAEILEMRTNMALRQKAVAHYKPIPKHVAELNTWCELPYHCDDICSCYQCMKDGTFDDELFESLSMYM